MGTTDIEWTDAVWNPVTGCSKVSAGCKNCYAERIANRQIGTFAWNPADGPYRKFTDVRCHPERLEQPMHWRKPRRIFVNSMSDLFHESVPNEFIFNVWLTMDRCPQHIFQILTKRPARMKEFLSKGFMGLGSPNSYAPNPNVWLGVSVEDQATADERIPLLLQTPATVRFVSLEPMLGPVDITKYMPDADRLKWFDGVEQLECGGKIYPRIPELKWVIVGGESGPKARPCEVDWVRSVIRQCKAAGTACFVKQLGSNPTLHGFVGMPLKNSKGSNPDEWSEDLRIREFPKATCPNAKEFRK